MISFLLFLDFYFFGSARVLFIFLSLAFFIIGDLMFWYLDLLPIVYCVLISFFSFSPVVKEWIRWRCQTLPAVRWRNCTRFVVGRKFRCWCLVAYGQHYASPVHLMPSTSEVSRQTTDSCKVRSGQVRYGDIHRSSASPRPPCDGTPSASVWPSPRQTPGPVHSRWSQYLLHACPRTVWYVSHWRPYTAKSHHCNSITW